MQKLLLAACLIFASIPAAFAQDSANKPKIPWDDIETNWQNGNDRRDSSVFHNKYINPILMVDISYTHSFNHPNDNTVVGPLPSQGTTKCNCRSLVLAGSSLMSMPGPSS